MIQTHPVLDIELKRIQKIVNNRKQVRTPAFSIQKMITEALNIFDTKCVFVTYLYVISVESNQKNHPGNTFFTIFE